jgi:hypothetical protein
VNGTPSLAVEEIKTDDTVGVDMRVPRDRTGVVFNEDYFRCLKKVKISIGLHSRAEGKVSYESACVPRSDSCQ